MPRGVNDFDTGRIQGRNAGDANSFNVVSPGIIDDSLLLYFDAGNYQSYPIAGTTWYDLSGRRSNGTLTNGPVYIRDGGGAIDFDGTNDVVSGVISSDISSDFSIEFFIKRDGSQLSFNSIFSLWNPSSPGPVAGSMQMDFGDVDGTNTLRVAIFTTVLFSDTTSLPDNTWTHFVFTKNGTTFSLFRNGVFVTSTTAAVTASLKDFVIAQNRAANKFFSGAVSFFRFYSRALSQQELLQNFNATRARFNI